jgi:predicted nucleic acid-binding protein
MDEIADGQDAAVNELIRLENEEEINLVLAHSVLKEINNPNTPAHVKRAANVFLRTMPVTLTQEEWRSYYGLLEAAIGNAEAKNISADLRHVFEAAKYGGYFITRDKRLLDRASVIRRAIDTEVVSPSEFIAAVAQAKKRAEELGLKKGKR